MKLHLLISATVIAVMPCHAQLSSEVNLGGGTNKSEFAKDASTEEITVTGIGTTLASAEKQALASAIRQAVGAYMDSKTIVENEEIIQDRILSVSNAFVEKYQVVGQPKKSADGLIEITILAKVKTNQVVQALKENNLISGEVAGQNLWAEASTKVMNAQDAVAMLEAKIPEFIKNSVTITPLNNKGLPMVIKDASGREIPSTAPAIVDEDASSGQAILTWYFEFGLDSKYYKETMFPIVKHCIDAIMGCDSLHNKKLWNNNSVLFTKKPFESRDLISDLNNSNSLPKSFIRENVIADFYDRQRNSCPPPIIVKSIPLNFNFCEYLTYSRPKYDIFFEIDGQDSDWEIWYKRGLASLDLNLLDLNGEPIAYSSQPAWTPIQTRNHHQWNSLVSVGPFTGGNSAYNSTSPVFIFPIICRTSIKLPIGELKNIKKIEVNLIPSKIHLSLRPIR